MNADKRDLLQFDRAFLRLLVFIRVYTCTDFELLGNS